MGELEAANEEYSIAVRQRQGSVARASGDTRKLATEPETIRSGRITADLESGLRQAPASADDAASAQGHTRPLASPVPLDEEEITASAGEGEGD
jgi:hypothetical protein